MRCPRAILALVSVCLTVLGAGCAPRVTVDPLASWNACLERCNRSDELGRLTYAGCRQGCDMALDTFAFSDRVFIDAETCAGAVARFDAAPTLDVLEARCMEEGTQVHRRRGCRDAVRVFYDRLGADMCVGGQAAASSGVGPGSSREEYAQRGMRQPDAPAAAGTDGVTP